MQKRIHHITLFFTFGIMIFFAPSQAQPVKNQKLLFNNGLNISINDPGPPPDTDTSTTQIADFSSPGWPTFTKSLPLTGGQPGEGINHVENSSGDIIAGIQGTQKFILDQNMDTMPGSVGMKGDNSTTEIAVCPNPAQSDQYYVFYKKGNQTQGTDTFFYAVIDFSLRGGLGDVQNLNTYVPTNDVAEGFEVIEVSDGSCGTGEFWLLAIESGVGLVRWEVGATGFDPGTKTTLYSMNTAGIDTIPLGELDYTNGKVAWIDGGGQQVYFGKFSNVTGTLTGVNNISTLSYGRPYGLEVSPDTSKLYVSTEEGGVIQYDLHNPPAYNPQVVAQKSWGQLELAVNDKIYLSATGDTQVYVIDQPNLSAPACGFDSLHVFEAASNGGITDPVQWAGCDPLSIETANFTVQKTEEQAAALTWALAGGPGQAASVAVQRSFDGKHYATIGRINNPESDHRFVDPHPQDGKNYYRLKIRTSGGTTEYSEVKSVNFSTGKAAPSLKVRTGQFLSVTFECHQTNTPAQLALYNVKGQVVRQKELGTLPTGIHHQQVTTTSLENGLYIVSLQMNGQQFTRKVWVR